MQTLVQTISRARPNFLLDFSTSMVFFMMTFAKRDQNFYSESIINWQRSTQKLHLFFHKNILGEMRAESMSETTFLDLKVRLGYPYVFLHQGNCEHIIIFTDIRLHHQNDVPDPQRFPLLRGQASKLSVKCVICSLNLANWIVLDEPRLPIAVAHVCHRCLKMFCYNHKAENAVTGDKKLFHSTEYIFASSYSG
ncbi:snRNA-activating protein complex subunit 3-like [Penaeus monodon]|uniref:snRNA-activating protein complex subunit 3-like n=1 Tax=Penaeus monodon TaxID=6687 RepID=UPI0018A76FA5|nr:snRNA-activating protein complex subunit 3-like [Penaeus monodon]